MRIQIPDNFSEDNVTVLANSLFVHFANDFSRFICSYMEEKFGPLWLQELKINSAQYRNFNPKDPAALLKDLARNGSSQLRQALNVKIERGFRKNYYEDLDDLLGERNAWLHRQVQESTGELLELLIVLMRVSKPLNLQVVSDCVNLQKAILGSDSQISPHENVVVMEKSESVDFTLTQKILPEPLLAELFHPETGSYENIKSEGIPTTRDLPRENLIGTQINERLLSHSYVLHLDGQISDRSSGELLSHFFPESGLNFGKILLERKPNGGRIRVTAEGVLCAFFGDKWGYLGSVQFDQWFPDHLTRLDEKGERNV